MALWKQIGNGPWELMRPDPDPRDSVGVELPKSESDNNIPIPCYLYIIRAGESFSYKIGISFDPAARLLQLQTGNHLPLRLIMLIPFMSESDSRRVEKNIHEKLKPFNSSGEWFTAHPTIIGSIVFNCLEE